jgi:hypothetical protein
MATATSPRTEGQPSVARVDYLVDENGNRVDVPDDSEVTVTNEVERAVASTSPTNWWQISLVALGIMALILLVLQLFGGTPGTDVQPGTPTAEVQQPVADP